MVTFPSPRPQRAVTGEDARKLVDYILSPHRTRPLLALSTRRGHDAPDIDPEGIADLVRPADDFIPLDIAVIAAEDRSDAAEAFRNRMGERGLDGLGAYNGAARLYPARPTESAGGGGLRPPSRPPTRPCTTRTRPTTASACSRT